MLSANSISSSKSVSLTIFSYAPCFKAFLLPLGAPFELPPCHLHTFFPGAHMRLHLSPLRFDVAVHWLIVFLTFSKKNVLILRMKAISVKQPWASLLAAGHKTVECRTWKTVYRGELLICSSKGDFEINDGLVAPGGMALGVVELLDVRPMTKADVDAAYLPQEWVTDALKGFAWHVRKLYEIKPFPIKGRLNLFTVDAALEKLPLGFKDHCVYLDHLAKAAA